MENQITLKEIGELSLFRKIMKFAPCHCSYCGKMHVNCHSKDINIMMPIPQNGKACPDGHEGYVVIFTGYAEFVKRFDFVKNTTNI